MNTRVVVDLKRDARSRVVVDAAGEGEAEVVGVEVGAVHKRLK